MPFIYSRKHWGNGLIQQRLVSQKYFITLPVKDTFFAISYWLFCPSNSNNDNFILNTSKCGRHFSKSYIFELLS